MQTTIWNSFYVNFSCLTYIWFNAQFSFAKLCESTQYLSPFYSVHAIVLYIFLLYYQFGLFHNPNVSESSSLYSFIENFNIREKEAKSPGKHMAWTSNVWATVGSVVCVSDAGVRIVNGVGDIRDKQVKAATKCGTIATGSCASVNRLVVIPVDRQFLGPEAVYVIQSEEKRSVTCIKFFCIWKQIKLIWIMGQLVHGEYRNKDHIQTFFFL